MLLRPRSVVARGLWQRLNVDGVLRWHRRIARQFSVPKATRYAEPKSLPQRGCDRREPTALFVAGSAERAHHVGHELGDALVAVVREGEPEPYDDKLRRRHDDHILEIGR